MTLSNNNNDYLLLRCNLWYLFHLFFQESILISINSNSLIPICRSLKVISLSIHRKCSFYHLQLPVVSEIFSSPSLTLVAVFLQPAIFPYPNEIRTNNPPSDEIENPPHSCCMNMFIFTLLELDHLLIREIILPAM